jgi:hypothetical protein
VSGDLPGRYAATADIHRGPSPRPRSLDDKLRRARFLYRNMCYFVTVVTIERVQTGLRIERNTLKVLKGLAEYLDVSLGNLVEGIVLHAFEGKTPFGQPTLAKIDQLKAVYGLVLTATDAHQLKEQQ